MYEVTLTGWRGDEWQKAIGRRTFPVSSAVPDIGGMHGELCFQLDLRRLSTRELSRIAAYLAEKFDLSVNETMLRIEEEGIPIPARGLIDPQGRQL